MSSMRQSTLGEIAEDAGPETKSTTVTKTLVCGMKTSCSKNEQLRPAINDWQAIAGHMADLMPSYDESQWGLKLRKDQRIKRDFPDVDLYAAVRNEAAFKVNEAFASWKSNGKRGDAPRFGDGSYIRFRADYVTIAESDEKYGVQLGINPDTTLWWGLRIGEYQRAVLSDIVADGSGVTPASAEVHMHDDGLSLHINYTTAVEVYRAPETDRWLGVDLGEAKMWVASPVKAGEPIGAATFDQHSAEFRETRERLSRETSRLAERGDKSAVKARRERRNYTDTMTHTAACEIADLATEYSPCGIAIEDLSGYRKDAENPIHDWPYFELQQKILYKAKERGLPVRKVNPAGTSSECWKCGDGHGDRVEREWLVCDNCGDRRHADVNAAINIGIRGAD